MIKALSFALGTLALNCVVSTAHAADAKEDCAVKAFQAYNAANLALLQKDFPLVSVNTLIAQRRLQESYCLQHVRCMLVDMKAAATAMVLSAQFDLCLQNEAAAKYDLVPRDRK